MISLFPTPGLPWQNKVGWLASYPDYHYASVGIPGFPAASPSTVHPLGWCLDTVLKTKKLTIAYLLFKTQEVQVNNCYYQEIPSRNKNHTSHDQFKFAKLTQKHLIQSQPREPQRREKKCNLRESPTFRVVRLSRYRRSSSCYPIQQILLPRLTVKTVPPLCCVAIVGRRREGGERS